MVMCYIIAHQNIWSEIFNIKTEEDVYGETQHFYQPDSGNLQMTELMTGLINKLDNLQNLNPEIVHNNRAIEE